MPKDYRLWSSEPQVSDPTQKPERRWPTGSTDRCERSGDSVAAIAVVVCKPGKDRTAMHVTYKQSQFANLYKRNWSPDASSAVIIETCLEDATIIRTHADLREECRPRQIYVQQFSGQIYAPEVKISYA